MEGRTIGNVNILDMRSATEASVATIKQIGNLNVLLYSRQTAALSAILKARNTNTSVEVPADASLQNVMGSLRINRDYFTNLKAQVFLFVFGQVVVETDVQAEDIDKWVGGIVVFGQVIYPASLSGVIGSKARQTFGQMMAYPAGARVEFDEVALDEAYLGQLPDGSVLAVIGEVRAPQVVPNELLQRKLKQLVVTGSVSCHEENAAAIKACLVGGGGKLKVLPAGFTEYRKALTLDNALIEYLPARKLYCTEMVQIAADMDGAQLDKHLDALMSRQLVLCPLPLKSVLAKKCNPFENKVVFYEGELILADNDSHLSPARLSRIKGKATLVVTGGLRIDTEVTPQMLADRLAKVHNLGEILGTPEQLGAIESLLGLHDGHLQDVTAKEEEPPDEETNGNINFLTL